ncbi:porin [Yoonia sp. 208BN28-4]|uniref:porin n=1 Tax=Yoonia sp. 208BN28-4 TaxID=3126505 RepID=UPI0030A7BB40
MKSILLTSTALVAFAGAAAADGHASVSYGLGATLGYNDTVAATDDNNEGFYWEGNLKATASAALDNGVTAGAYFEVTVAEDDGDASDDGGIALSSSDWVVSLESDMASLYFGDTSTAATKHWVSAGDMEADDFTTGTDSAVLRGDVSFAGFDTSLSYIYDDDSNELEQLSLGAAGSFGAFTVSAGYQADTDFADASGDFNASEVYGISVGGTFAGATVTAGYASNETNGEASTGIKLAYPFGPVTAEVYYVMEEVGDDNYGVKVTYDANGIAVTAAYRDEQGRPEYNIDASYDLGNGLVAIGGILNENEGDDIDYYVGATYDLGGGASVLMTYAGDEDGDQADEIGAGDYQEGITVEVSFAF